MPTSDAGGLPRPAGTTREEKRRLASAILAQETYEPESSLLQRVHSALCTLPGDVLADLALVLTLRDHEVAGRALAEDSLDRQRAYLAAIGGTEPEPAEVVPLAETLPEGSPGLPRETPQDAPGATDEPQGQDLPAGADDASWGRLDVPGQAGQGGPGAE